jgi:zinc transporter, ZIP family
VLDELLLVLLIAGLAGLSSPLAGVLTLLRTPTSLFISSALGFASGVLIATISLEIIPESMELASLGIGVAGFIAGVALIYALDLYMHRGKLAGELADQRVEVERFHRRRPPRGDKVNVLATGTTVEETVEGMTIGFAVAAQPEMALIIGLAIALDNFSEGLSIAALIRSGNEEWRRQAHRILVWTSIIGFTVFASAVISVLALQRLSDDVIGFFLAFGGAGLLYLTLTSLVPSSQQRQYQQSAGLAAAMGFLVVLVLTQLL